MLSHRSFPSFESCVAAYVEKYAVTLASLSAVLLLAMVLAHWTWQWLAPAPVTAVVSAAPVSVRHESVHNLFGRSAQQTDAVASTGLAIRLLGIVAAVQGKNGYAVVQLDNSKIMAVREGENISPGILLSEVRNDHLVILRHGTRETLAWQEKKP